MPNIRKDDLPPPPPPKKARTSKDPKPQLKVQPSEPKPKPKAKSIVIQEPFQPQTRSKSSVPTGKDKGKETAVDIRASQEEARIEAVLQRLKGQSKLGTPSEQTSSQATPATFGSLNHTLS